MRNRHRRRPSPARKRLRRVSSASTASVCSGSRKPCPNCSACWCWLTTAPRRATCGSCWTARTWRSGSPRSGACGGCDAGGRRGPVAAGTCRRYQPGDTATPGHLLPQTLIGQDGLLEAASLRCLRVMRIATHPALERRGIATGLLQALAHWAGPRGCDYLGTGFGATVDLLRFWQRSGYRPVHVGAGRDPVGGTFACMLARPLSAAGHALVEAARAQLRRRLLHQLPAQMRELDADLVLSLLPSGDSTQLSASERSEIELFARHNRSFESCEPSLWALCRSGPELWQRAGLGRDAQYQLIWTLLQRRGWETVAALSGAGRRAQIRGLRSTMALLLEAVPTAQRSRTPEGDHDG
ncbi:GNAT family N-acetyltransferase [Marinobacterium aestuariivivens]|uniref:GNAT family N-acetyltransferase n=1 Tax=Marinobacterium aestuariivivens TaxID=1698799 RepID=A0ABW1ZUS1_9GAMM